MKNPKLKLVEGSVPVFNYSVLESIKLTRDITPLDISFDTVVDKRRSTRSFNPITLQQLSDVLWYVAKVKTAFVQDNGYILTHRGASSAGARHPIDIIIYNSELLSEHSLYYYNPFEHSLNKLSIPNFAVSSFINHIDGIVNTTNATVLWFVAHKGRTKAKYKNADSLVYRDAGVLIHAIQMVSTALSLSSCPIGSLGEPFVSGFFDNQVGVSGAGGLLIG